MGPLWAGTDVAALRACLAGHEAAAVVHAALAARRRPR